MNQLLLEKVSKAIGSTQDMLAETPHWKSLEVALEQLRLLQGWSLAAIPNRSVLDAINLGLLAVREFDERDPEYADALIEIQRLVKVEKNRGVRS